MRFYWGNVGSQRGPARARGGGDEKSLAGAIPRGFLKLDFSVLGKDVHGAGAFDFASDFAVKAGGDAGDFAGKDFSGFGSELGKNVRVLIVDGLDWAVDALARHALVRFAEIDPTLDGFWFGHGEKRLAKFAVKGSAAKEGVILLLFKASRGAEALFVAG